MTAIPKTWTNCKIGEIAQIVSGGTPPSRDSTNFASEEGIPWITPADLSGYENIYISRGARSLSQKGFDSCSASILPEGSVLFSSRAPIGYVAIAANELTTNQGFKSFILPKEFDSRFVYYYLLHIKPVAEAMATGTTFKELSGSNAAQLPFIVAPVNEQKRIANKLDTLLARVHACLDRLERIPLILRRFRQAVLRAAFYGDLTADWRLQHSTAVSGMALLEQIRAEHRNWWLQKQIEAMQKAGKSPDDDNWKQGYKPSEPVDEKAQPTLPVTWAWASGAEIVAPGSEIVYGIVQPGSKLEDGVPYVRGLDIENGQILVSQLMKTSRTIADRYSRSSLAGGDVLLGIIRATKVAVVPEELTGGNITQGTARFRPSSIIRTDYLARVLEAPSTQSWLHQHYRGIDMPGLNLADVRRVPIPLAPLAEQDEIIRRVDALFAFAARLERRWQAAVSRIEQLSPAFLDKAFRGELVSQDPNDEPATILLERIRAAQVDVPVAPKRDISRKPNMTKLTEETIRETIRQFPKEPFSFDELRQSLSGDYEALKEMVFALLGEGEPSITQVFDQDSEEMRFVRRQK